MTVRRGANIVYDAGGEDDVTKCIQEQMVSPDYSIAFYGPHE
jgi:hypothetical protein